MSRPEALVTLVDLDHVPLDAHRTLVRVIARLPAYLDRVAEAELLVSRADTSWLSFPARTWDRDGAGLWRAVFAVPSATAQRPEFGFALTVAGRTIPLPHPTFAATARAQAAAMPLGIAAAPELASTALSALSAPGTRLPSGRLRTRAVALATIFAITASSTPALAVAEVGNAPAVPHAWAARERIEQLAVYAVERIRASSTRQPALTIGPSSRANPTGRAAARRGGLGSRQQAQLTPAAPTAAPPTRVPAVCSDPALARRDHRLAIRMQQLHCATLGTKITSTPARPAPAAPATGGVASGTGTTPTSTSTTAAGTTAPSTGTTPAGTTPTSASTTPAPAPSPNPTSPAPAPTTTPPATAAPRPSRSGRERPSRRQLAVTLPGLISGGGALSPAAGRHTASAPAGTGGAGVTLSPSPPGFRGPKSWTGAVVADPALQSLLGNLSATLTDANQPPAFLVPVYMEAGRRYGIPWPVLAAINSVETDYGRNLNTSSAGAIGWMQFEPSTWKTWGVAADGHSVANPYDPRDAIFSAARYLAAAGGRSDISRAIYAYNHAGWYVNMVLGRAHAIGAAVRPRTHTTRRGIITTFFAEIRGRGRKLYRGGYLTHYTRLIATANMVSAASFSYSWGGGHEQPARFGPFDCSGSVSYVLQQAGYTVPTVTSGNVPSWRFPAGPGRVTIFYNATHTFMRIGNRYFGTSTSRPGGGAGWIGTAKLPENYLANFNEVHVPYLHGDAFAAARHRAALRAERRAAHRRSDHSAGSSPVRFAPLPSRPPSQLQFSFPTT